MSLGLLRLLLFSVFIHQFYRCGAFAMISGFHVAYFCLKLLLYFMNFLKRTKIVQLSNMHASDFDDPAKREYIACYNSFMLKSYKVPPAAHTLVFQSLYKHMTSLFSLSRMPCLLRDHGYRITKNWLSPTESIISAITLMTYLN